MESRWAGHMMEDNHKFEFTNLKTSPIGLGAWQIGDRLFWSYGRTHQYEDSYEALLQSLNHGVNFIDTAEVYGFGMSERMIGGMLQKIGARPVISTKYFPYPWRLTSNSVVLALKRSLSRLHLEHVELYQIHWPIPSFLISTWAKGLIEIARTGLARYIGVSNFTHNQVKRMYRLLNENDIQLVSNQVEYNLLNRRIEKNGLMDLCNQLGIKIIAYSPLAQGLLTGKYDYERPGSGLRKLTYAKLSQEKLRVLVGRLRDIGSNYGGKTPAQVAINWLICKGVVPIPGAKNGQQAQENAGALGWRLSEEDVIGLEKSSDGIWKNE